MKSKPTLRSGAVVKPKVPELAPASELELKQILVPVDFSNSSRKALDYAVAFARKFNAGILLFHAVPLPGGPQFPIAESVTYDIESFKQAEKQLTVWSKAIDPILSVRTSVQNGNPQQEIVRAAHDNNIDLIVIGNHGRSGLARILLGSTTELVVRHAPCPVLVIREREQDFIGASKESAAHLVG